jgi:hypothetical protein
MTSPPERQLKALGTDDASQQLALLLNEQRQPVLQVGMRGGSKK